AAPRPRAAWRLERPQPPSLPSVGRHLDFGDAAASGERDATDGDLASGPLHVAAGDVDARVGVHDRAVRPALLHPVSEEVVVDHLDSAYPLHVFHAVDVRDEHACREAVLLWNGLTVTKVRDVSQIIACLSHGDRGGVAVD